MILYYKLVKIMEHGMCETAEFHKNNIEYLVKSYVEAKSERKEIYAIMEQHQQLLIRQTNGFLKNMMLETTLEERELELECQRAAARIQQKILLREGELQKNRQNIFWKVQEVNMRKNRTFPGYGQLKKRWKQRKLLLIKECKIMISGK